MRLLRICLVFILTVFSLYLTAEEEKAVVRIDVKAGEAEGVIRVGTRVGIATAFEFQGGEIIKDLILGDPKFWVAESNGRVAVVRQLKSGVKTSLFIYTNKDILYTFLLGEGNGKDVVKVIIENPSTDNIFEKSLTDSSFDAGNCIGEEVSKRKRRVNMGYKIKDKYFRVEACFDDGVFTTIQLDSKAQIKPAIFLSREKDKLEQVRYSEEDGVYRVHYILQKKEFFVLKEGKKMSIIGS